MTSELAQNTPVKKRRNQFLKTPKGYLLITLLVLLVISVFGPDSVRGLLSTGVAALTAVAVDWIIARIKKWKRAVPDGAVLTGLIVGLVLSTSVSLVWTAATATIAILSKHLLRIKKKPIFNPATFGLLIADWVFSTDQSWWGAMSLLPAAWVAAVAIGGVLIARRVNKFPMVTAFLGVYFAAFLVLGMLHVETALSADALRVPFVNSALFFAFFMLTDPPNSPTDTRQQVAYGVLAAAVSVGLYMTVGGLSYLYAGLLIANGWNAYRLWKM